MQSRHRASQARLNSKPSGDARSTDAPLVSCICGDGGEASCKIL
jgi:hypothetical protein